MRWAVFVAMNVLLGTVPAAQTNRVVHWPAGAIVRVWIDPLNAPPNGQALVEKAMRTWSTASAGKLSLTRTLLRDDAAITVTFDGAGGNYGETRPLIDPRTGLIIRAEVRIAADVPFEPFTRQIVAYLTALHELGHALGLGHTTNFTDIMYLFRYPDDGVRYFGNYRALLRSADDIGSATASGLSSYDVEALGALYEETR